MRKSRSARSNLSLLLLAPLLIAAAACAWTQTATAPRPPSTKVIAKADGNDVLEIAFIGNSGLAISSNLNSVSTIWNLAESKEQSRFSGPVFQFSDLALSSDSHSLLTPGPGTSIHLWDLATGHDIRVFNGITDTVAVALSPDGSMAASGGAGHLQVWDIKTSKQLYAFPATRMVTTLAFEKQANRLISVENNGNICRWKLSANASNDCKAAFQNPNTRVSFYDDGHFAVIATDDDRGEATLWDVDRAVAIRVIKLAPFITHPSLSPDGKMFVFGSPDHHVELWNLQTGRKVAQMKRFGTDILGSAAFSSDGSEVLLANEDGTIVLWTLR